MNRKLSRRVIMAAGASIAGAAIPIAAASNAWADDEITFDGIVLFDDFDASHPFGSSDVGTLALSGTHGDFAWVEGPAALNTAANVGLANDSAATDVNDVAFWSGTTPTTVFAGDAPGASLVNATGSYAAVFGGGNAYINLATNGVEDPITGSGAIASNGGFADVGNDGLAPPGVTVTNDFAYGNGTGTGALAGTPSVATVYDSGNSSAIANDTGFNFVSQNQGAAVDLANNSFAYGDNTGSGADIIGTGTTAVANDSNFVGDGMVFTESMSNLFQIDGIPDATFLADLFGENGAAAFTTAFTDLLALF